MRKLPAITNEPTVVGLGEILWDLLPSGRQLGGAPANFAYCSHLLGNRAHVASRIGADQLGHDIRRHLAKAGLGEEFLQIDSVQPTGIVRVQLDGSGQPKFEITQPVAWDFLEWTDEWKTLARSADAVCFGSLAQRSAQSRATILNFLRATRTDCLRVFDVNLRQNFYSAEIICESLQFANVVKLNHEEVPRVEQLLDTNDPTEISFARNLVSNFDLKFACVTRGSEGSLLCDGSSINEHAGLRVRVKDTIGAGDAFTSGLVHGALRGWSLAEMNDCANRMGAWVASHSGAMPERPRRGLEAALADVGGSC